MIIFKTNANVGQCLCAIAYLCAASALHWFILFVIQGHTDMQVYTSEPGLKYQKTAGIFQSVSWINWCRMFFNLSGERAAEEEIWSEVDISSSEGSVFPWTLIQDLHRGIPLLTGSVPVPSSAAVPDFLGAAAFTPGRGSLTSLQGGDFQPLKRGALHTEREHLFPVYLCIYAALEGVEASNHVEI